MAAKKKTTVTEEVIEDTPEEKQLDYKEIHDNDIKTLAKPEGGEPALREEKPEETKLEDQTETPPEADPKPEFDIEENNRKIAEETAQKTRDEIAELLKGKNRDETKKNLDEYDQYVEDYTQKNGRTPEWKILANFTADLAVRKVEERQQKAYETAQEQQKKSFELEESQKTMLNTMIDEEMAELYNSNKLTRVKNAEDPSDPGLLERKALFQTMLDINQTRVAEGKSPIYSPIRIFTNHFKKPNQQPAGAEAFMQGDMGGSSNANSDENYSYGDIHNTPWDRFVGMFKK